MEEIIKATSKFESEAKKFFSKSDLKDLYTYLQLNPEAGDIIPQTGGVRKLRWKNPKSNKGKSGGLRIIYFYCEEIIILLITLYSKSKTESMSDQDKRDIKKLIKALLKDTT